MPSFGNSFSPSGGAFAGANGRGEALFSGGYHRLFVQDQRDGGTYSMHRLASLAKQAKAVCFLRKAHAAEIFGNRKRARSAGSGTQSAKGRAALAH